jgi:hypothetical protein
MLLVAGTEESSWEDATEIESERNKLWPCSLEKSALLVRRSLGELRSPARLLGVSTE